MSASDGLGREVHLAVGPIWLSADLSAPSDVTALVLLAHVSGSSRFSPLNHRVRRAFHDAGMGTVLLDLLTADEEALALDARDVASDLPALVRRLEGAVDWLALRPDTARLPLGIFASGTAAAAALIASVERPAWIRAVACKGARPHLAGAALGLVRVPTLFLVGAEDAELLALNLRARHEMTLPAQLVVIERASHRFEEPGTLEILTVAAARFFRRHLQTIDDGAQGAELASSRPPTRFRTVVSAPHRGARNQVPGGRSPEKP